MHACDVSISRHLLLQLSCPFRQVQLCNPILSEPKVGGLARHEWKWQCFGMDAGICDMEHTSRV
eukprot:867788-Pelagomonas_calceolata.AAC.6